MLEDLTLYVFYDLTERKRVEEALRESEEKFSLIFKRAPLMAAISDLENSALLEVNDKLLATFGAGREEALGRNVVELGWMRAEDRDRIVQTLQSGEKVAGLEVTCRANDGRAVHCLFHCELVSIANAKRVLTLALDVTEHKRAEGDKAELEAQLRQAQKMEAVGTLAGGIAHDFNNILSTVFGFAEMAMESAKTGWDNTSDLRQILAAGERAKELVRQILTLQPQGGGGAETPGPEQGGPAGGGPAGTDHSKMISIETRLEPGLGPVRANANQMEQILLNLATNAQDAMPDGGRLSIETRRVDLDQAYSLQHLEVRPGRYVLLQVSDTGKGVDEAAREHIFEPFYTTKDVGKGTGLGLSTVYGIVKGHQGEIYCYSEPGYGTTFKIYLPVVEDAPQAAGETAELPLSALQGAERILLVDDEEALRELGARTLSMAGYSVETAASGEEALEAFKADGGGFDPGRAGPGHARHGRAQDPAGHTGDEARGQGDHRQRVLGEGPGKGHPGLGRGGLRGQAFRPPGPAVHGQERAGWEVVCRSSGPLVGVGWRKPPSRSYRAPPVTRSQSSLMNLAIAWERSKRICCASQSGGCTKRCMRIPSSSNQRGSKPPRK